MDRNVKAFKYSLKLDFGLSQPFKTGKLSVKNNKK
jgi:hypothetical protein